jgi:hypothetical protein
MGQRSTVPGQRQRIAAIEPAPACRASNELIGVMHGFANGIAVNGKALNDKAVNDMAAAVGHLRLRQRRRCVRPIGAAEARNLRATIVPPATLLFARTLSSRAPAGGPRFDPVQPAWRGRCASPLPRRGATEANGE